MNNMLLGLHTVYCDGLWDYSHTRKAERPKVQRRLPVTKSVARVLRRYEWHAHGPLSWRPPMAYGTSHCTCIMPVGEWCGCEPLDGVELDELAEL